MTNTSENFLGTAERLIVSLRKIVGRRHVLDRPRAMRSFLTGYRYGGGPATAVVRPASLVEFWKVLQVCVEAGAAIICQAANTSLTGGATPFGNDYPECTIIVSTNRLGGIHVLNGGKQVVCMAGATLHQLERTLKPIGRDPHSVIGSSCIGASVIGGVCNNSGGAMVQRGPAFTQMALFAQIDESGRLRLVNHLDIDLGDQPEIMLRRLERCEYEQENARTDPRKWGSDREYAKHVRNVQEATPARYNADTRRLFEASGCAGKLAVFAVRLDTFERPVRTQTFYLGTNRSRDLAVLRSDILSQFEHLPVSAEYMHRTAFNLAERYGKDTFLAISYLGTDRIGLLNRLKSSYDSTVGKTVSALSSHRVLQAFSRLTPQHIPVRLREFRDRYDHHLILTVAGDAIEEMRAYLAESFASEDSSYFECSVQEARKAELHRFVVAGAAVRYQAIHAKFARGIVALDVALPRNEIDWFIELPADLNAQILGKIYYGHFLCHVFHLDYLVRKDADIDAVKRQLLRLMDDRRAEYPAEHNVGHLYEAKPALRDFYRSLDPGNRMNPGIGRTTRRRDWAAKN